MSDNIIAASYVNNKGELNQSFVIELQKSYRCGVHHKICGYQLRTFLEHKLDSFSRNCNETFEWKLSTHLFQNMSSMFINPTLDLFASHINYQIDRYISWKPNLKALAIDAFSIKWNTEFYYIFPPIFLTKAIVVIPKQPIQPLEKSDKKYEYNTVSKKFGTTPGPTNS